MAGRIFGNDRRTVPVQAGASDGGSPRDGSSPTRDRELQRMAAFRVREAANRIAVLANSAQNDGLRETLLAICQRLLSEERTLLDGGGPARDG